MVHALQSGASSLVDHSGATFDTSHVTGHELRRAGARHLAGLRLPLGRIQFYGQWSGMSVLAHVLEAVKESQGLLGLEPTLGSVERSTRGCCGRPLSIFAAHVLRSGHGIGA